MKKGDKVRLTTRVYALNVKEVHGSADLTKMGAKALVVRVIDDNAVVVQFPKNWNGDRLQAPVHPSKLQRV